MRKLIAAAILLTIVVTERERWKMYKGSENVDRKGVVNSSPGGSIERCRELEIYRRDLGFA